MTLREAAESAVEAARPHARELGAGEALDGIAAILAAGNGADRRRAAAARGGGDAMLAEIVRETDPDSIGRGG
jgi:gamma-glutamyl:cysteine ligase YbdK (ATP-grasp superfamily)